MLTNSDTDVQLSDTDVQLSDTDVQLSDTDVQLSDTDVQLSDLEVSFGDLDVTSCDPFRKKVDFLENGRFGQKPLIQGIPTDIPDFTFLTTFSKVHTKWVVVIWRDTLISVKSDFFALFGTFFLFFAQKSLKFTILSQILW